MSSGSSHIDALMADIRPRIESIAVSPASKSVLRESSANVLGVVADLPLRSPIVSARLAAEKLVIVGALYHLASGHVEWLDDKGNATAAVLAAAALPTDEVLADAIAHAHAHAHAHVLAHAVGAADAPTADLAAE